MVSLNNPSPLSTAQALAAAGLQVLPARHRDKAPIVDWHKFQDVRSEGMLPQWFGSTTPRNYWVMTGQMSKVVVVDCDNAAADLWWRERLGDEVMSEAGRVKTRKGHHYWFRIPADWTEGVSSWSVHPKKTDDPDGMSFDVRADLTGVIVPPSVHETGHVYTWERPLSAAIEAPTELLDGSIRLEVPGGDGKAGEGQRKAASGVVRSMLTGLLADPPGGDGTGRNDWLARVAGHYAKQYHNQHDLYEAHCAIANQAMGTPLDEAEYDKTIQSVWRGEHERNAHRAMDGTCGWLQSGGTRIMTQVAIKDKEGNTTYTVEEWADFDLRAAGVMLAEDLSRSYWVQIVRKKRGTGETETIDAVLDAKVAGDDRALRKWLAQWACTIVPPMSMWPKEGTMGVRLQRYLESQHPPAVKVTSTLGWDSSILTGSGGFVTHDGVITEGGLIEMEVAGVRPHPNLLTGGTAPHRYGFEGKDRGEGSGDQEARRVLREVLSFHHDLTTAVFGSWWAACLLKPQIEARTSLFPFMAIEAPSESGKTNGFFQMMTQLNGNTRGETQPTKAALRDMAAAHRSGIVWVDDLDDPTYLMELLRAATSGGTLTKMGEDRESVKNTQIVAPIVISGEALGLGSQKALLDRAIILKVTSPTDRRNKEDSGPQWDDVLTLRSQYPDGLAAVSGWLVQDALAVTGQVMAALASGRQGGAGRTGDKYAILRAGARLLDYLVATDQDAADWAWDGKGKAAPLVEQWIAEAEASGVGSNENSLTLEILPWALRTFKYPDKPYAGDHERDLDRPVFIRNKDRGLARTVQGLLGGPEVAEDGPEIWFNTALLAQAWEREKHGRIERRTQTEGAFRDQANALHAPSQQYKIVNGGGRRASYRRIDGDIARAILDRAEGR